jgi:DNA (cytosine-5)-methyltransferase 1
VRVLDLFCGAGGLSLGVEQAGFEIRVGAEWDPDACETFAKAHPSAEVWPGDVGVMDFRTLRGEVDVVIGGPPCQPWSSGGKRLGAADPRDGWPAFLRAIEQVRPAGFIAENVAGLAAGARRATFTALLAELRGLGFELNAGVLDAADHGVPQRRRRMFVVGSRAGPVELPAPSHGPGGGRPWRSAGQVVGAEPIGTANRSVVTYARLPDLRPNPYDGHVYNGGGRPIDLDRPAPTLLASMGGNKTPWVDTLGVVVGYHAHLAAGGAPRAGCVAGARRITIAEAALLQSFPAGMHFSGRSSSCYRQIGNAVPPQLAAVIAARLAQALHG